MSDNAVQQPQLPTAADVDGYLNNDPHITNFHAVMALSNSIKTTLGPKGLDKLLITEDNKIVATNDGGSIIDRMKINHPAAKMTTNIIEEQRTRAGDGTTTAIVLIGALLNSAVDLINRGVHPTDIIRGNRFAVERAVDVLNRQTVDVSVDRKQLETIAQTAINGKWDSDGREFIASKAVETVLSIEQDGAVDFSAITRKGIKGGSYYDSEIIDGLLIDTDSSSTDSVSPTVNIQGKPENVSVALIDNGLTINTASDQGTVTFDSPTRRNELHEYEDQKYIQHANKIIESGADIVFCQQSIDDPVKYHLADEDVLAVERTRRDEFEKLKQVTGAEPVADSKYLSANDTGIAAAVNQRTIAGTNLVIIHTDGETMHSSLLLRGGTKHVVEETKRVIDDCLFVLRISLRDDAVVPGGGATEVAIAQDLRQHARTYSGREQLAIGAYADAIEVIPRTLASTAGYDPVDALISLRKAHSAGHSSFGLNLNTGKPTNMIDIGVIEPMAIKRRILTSITEVANLLLRIDDVLPADSGQDGDEDNHDHSSESENITTQQDGYPWAVGHSMGH